MILPDVPCQIRPETAVLVSRTSRNPLFLTVGFDFRLDLLLRHRLLRASGKSIARLLEALQAVGRQFATQQILDRLGRKKSGSFCLFRKRVGKRDLDGGHDCHNHDDINLAVIARHKLY